MPCKGPNQHSPVQCAHLNLGGFGTCEKTCGAHPSGASGATTQPTCLQEHLRRRANGNTRPAE
eukprot:4397106-Alexandrium_andersonii.AAC.1